MTNRLPLTLELAEPMQLNGDLQIELTSATRSTQKSSSFNLLGIQVDVTADVQIDDVIA